ncbi:MAG: hypothetical protein WC898_02405 [Candidatus Paceibacterota bacterium]|jgi:hypothetical protein
MAKKYVSRIVLMRNGSRITDFKNYKKMAVPYAKEVELMDEDGVVEVHKKYKYSIDYVIPKVGAKQDWSDVRDETWSVQYTEGGPKTTYTGVDCIEEGESDVDGQKEVVMTLTFVADGRILE